MNFLGKQDLSNLNAVKIKEKKLLEKEEKIIKEL